MKINIKKHLRSDYTGHTDKKKRFCVECLEVQYVAEISEVELVFFPSLE